MFNINNYTKYVDIYFEQTLKFQNGTLPIINRFEVKLCN